MLGTDFKPGAYFYQGQKILAPDETLSALAPTFLAVVLVKVETQTCLEKTGHASSAGLF